MTDELRAKIERLEAQVAALTEERLPKVDRASKRRDRRQVLGGFGMFAIALLMAGSLSASALAGTNSVLTDDIAPKQVYNSDLADNAVSGTKVYNNSVYGIDIANNSVTGVDINPGRIKVQQETMIGDGDEGFAAFAHCPAGTTVTGGGWDQPSQAGGGPYMEIHQSSPPVIEDEAWVVRGTNETGEDLAIVVVAICDAL